jgi:beta-galactosidase
MRLFTDSFSKRFLLLLVSASLVTFVASAQQARTDAPTPAQQTLEFPTILYGAAYYNEYMPGDAAERDARLVKDIAMMKAAGLNVVRMGESTWSLWEPEDGRFDYAWMDHIVDAMGKAGIKVILGTPTYSIPAWMAHQHPEILADRITGGNFGGPTAPAQYGMRQNMDTDSPAFRFYAERLIRHIVAHYKDNPTVIGCLVSELLGREPAHMGRSAHAERRAKHRLQAGVVALEPDAGDGFSALAG